MNMDNFIRWISGLYNEIYNEKIRFPSFNEANSFHHESMMRMGIESKFFKIEGDIDNILKMSHLDYLHHHNLLIDTISLINRFTENRCDVVEPRDKYRIWQLVYADDDLLLLNNKPIDKKFISTKTG